MNESERRPSTSPQEAYTPSRTPAGSPSGCVRVHPADVEVYLCPESTSYRVLLCGEDFAHAGFGGNSVTEMIAHKAIAMADLRKEATP